jgi:hypothetical protein
MMTIYALGRAVARLRAAEENVEKTTDDVMRLLREVAIVAEDYCKAKGVLPEDK